MRSFVTIDGTGRIVVPRKVRNELRLVAGTALHIEHSGDRITLTPAVREAHLTIENGTPLIIPAPEAERPVLTTELVNDVVARGRLDRGLGKPRRKADEETA
ncbi:MAG: AbrB/MazE/SpoVT family DNA-binding domain-containing protein [Acidobacteriaceae bacterium]